MGLPNCLRSLAYFARDLEGALGRADRPDAELEAADVEDVEGDLVALADLAEQVLARAP